MNIKVCFLIPPRIKDYYGESAFILMRKLTKFESVVNYCDASVDIVFSSSFGCSDQVIKYKKKYPDKVFINYFWDLPFWRAQNGVRKRKKLIFKEPSWKERYISYLKSGDIIVSSSKHTRNEVLENYDINTEVLYLYFPNLDIDKIESTGPKENQIICVGRIEPYKRCDILIKALSLLNNPPSLLLVGDGSEKKNCIRLAQSLRLNMTSPGWLDRVTTIKEIKASLLSVNPSVMEGNCGWCPCEAVWAGIPAIMADIPETREFFGDKGLYFKPDNPESLAEQITDVFEKEQMERDKIQRECKEQISFYTVDRGIQRLEEYIENVAKEYL